MEQMYKIYLGSHCFFLGSKKSYHKDYDLVLKKPKGGDIVDVCEQLLKEKGPGRSILLDRKKKKLNKQIARFFTEVVAGGGVVYNNNKELLLIKRHGKWDLPKGKLEPNETIELCAIREVEEECNVFGLELGRLLDITYHFYKTKSGWKIKKAYWFKMDCKDSKQASPQKEEGIEEIKWVKPKDIDVEGIDTFGSIREVLRQL
jgi:ADP-ribose pyrophosphatase YjhB (NUDIX family)